MPDIQEIGGESETTHKLCGLDNPVTEDFGRQCLLARRFCEQGVRFVQVTHRDTKVQWEVHVLDVDLVGGTESFYTHGAEVAPWSDVVREDFENHHRQPIPFIYRASSLCRTANDIKA